VDWHFWVSTFLTAAIGAAAWLLAFLQLRINKNLSSQQLRLSHAKLKFDLYERRLALFSAVKKFALRVSQTSGEVDTLAFYRETLESNFLFDKEIVDYINDMHKRARLIIRIKETLANRLLDAEVRKELEAEITTEFDWFHKQHREVVNVFSQSLSIRTLEGQDSLND
jgi:hypothetical protein